MPHNQGVPGSSPGGTTKARHPYDAGLFWNMNILLTILGIISLGLGILGAFLPVLPTTPLLLLAAALFLRGNRGFYDWLMNHPKLGPYITNFMKHKSIPLRVKVVALTTLWLTLLFCAVFVAEHWVLRLCFIAIAIGVTIHILSYKTTDNRDWIYDQQILLFCRFLFCSFQIVM